MQFKLKEEIISFLELKYPEKRFRDIGHLLSWTT